MKQTNEKKEQIRNRIRKYNIKNPEKVRIWKMKSEIKNRDKDVEKSRLWKLKPDNRIKIKIYNDNYKYKIKTNPMRKKEFVEMRKKIEERYNNKYPERVLAHEIARKIIINRCCEHCGSIKNLHRHHEDYSKPLEVIILCQKCHVKLHQLKAMEILN